MYKISYDIDFGHVIKGFEQVSNVMKKDVPSILRIVGIDAHNLVRDLTPVDTGRLEQAWVNSDVKGGGGNYYVKISNSTPYAMPVERGFQMSTRFIPKEIGTGTGGFKSPERFFVGRFMARDTSEIIGGKMSSYFHKVEQDIVGCF